MPDATWPVLQARMMKLPSESQAKLAAAAASEVVAVWSAVAPMEVEGPPAHAAASARSWLQERILHSGLKATASAAYGAVGASQLPHGSRARSAGLAAAHAAFALHYLAEGDSGHVFTSARDAISNAVAACTDPGLLARLLLDARDMPEKSD